MWELHCEWSPGTELGACKDPLTQTYPDPHTCRCLHAHVQERNPWCQCKEVQNLQPWLELQLADVTRWWVCSKGCVFGNSWVSVCKPSLAWSLLRPPGGMAERWAELLGGSWQQLPGERPRQTAGAGGDARGQVSRQVLGRTCDYTFLILTTG